MIRTVCEYSRLILIMDNIFAFDRFSSGMPYTSRKLCVSLETLMFLAAI